MFLLLDHLHSIRIGFLSYKNVLLYNLQKIQRTLKVIVRLKILPFQQVQFTRVLLLTQSKLWWTKDFFKLFGGNDSNNTWKCQKVQSFWFYFHSGLKVFNKLNYLYHNKNLDCMQQFKKEIRKPYFKSLNTSFVEMSQKRKRNLKT